MIMRFHAQNLNEKPGPGNRTGSILRHGRCWWKPFRSEWRFEWTLFKWSSPGIVLNLADYNDEAIGGHVSVGLFALYWGLNHRWLRRYFERVTSRESAPHDLNQCLVCRQPRDAKFLPFCTRSGHVFTPHTYWPTNGRSIGVRWHDGMLWIDLWNDPMEHRSVDPRWWHWTVCPVDIVFGGTRYSETKLCSERVVVPMPEGGYAATVEIMESVWRRSRWPWAWRRMIRSTITPDIPIHFPGKGENAWDCGEDATSSMAGAHATAFDAAMALCRSVMRDRVRHGGWNYTPESMRQKQA